MKAGDHIYIYLKHESGFTFTHHGIYIGNKEVIHYWNNKVRKSTKNKFGCGKNIYIKKHKKCYSSPRVVKRAQRRLGETKYNLIFNNCEHFARWCKTGNHVSKQIDNAHIEVANYLYNKTQQDWENAQKEAFKTVNHIKSKVPNINPHKIQHEIQKIGLW